MRTSILMSLNGLSTITTGKCAFGVVKNKKVESRTANHWSSTEYNSNNAWNVNGETGNVNNNNKNNSNVVRAVCALSEEYTLSWIEAFHDCIRHKLSSKECCEYRIAGEEDVLFLAYEAFSLTYEPSISNCFCVTKPRLREVFAANFRDRIVHHWICLRLEPLFEERFRQCGDVSFNCRKGYGVLRAVQTVSNAFQTVSNDYKHEAWVVKLDISGFFMSIDRNVLWTMLRKFICENYHGYNGIDDKEILLYLVERIVKHSPQNLCRKKGDVSLFDQLAPNKTLFKSKPMIGMPIGNLTSQYFANFYMSEFDGWISRKVAEFGGAFVRFVDDMVIVGRDKNVLLELVSQIRMFLMARLHIKLHKDKFYFQPISRGVAFIGHVIKPCRLYVNNTLKSHASDRMHEMNLFCRKLIKKDFELTDIDRYTLTRLVCSLNSFMGFMVHAATYGIRRAYLKAYKYVWKFVYYDRCRVIKIKRKYQFEVTKSRRYERKRNWAYSHGGWKDICATSVQDKLCA